MSEAAVISLSDELNRRMAESEAEARAPIILEPGIYPAYPMGDYLRLPYMSASRLEKLRRSPLQYRHALTAPSKRTAALETGTALHLAVLEPHLFDMAYVVLGQCEGTTKAKERCSYQGSVYRAGGSYCKTHDPAKGAELEGVEVLTQSDHNDVVGMRDSINAHPRARSLFEGLGAFELTVVFTDAETGVRCRIRPDRLIERVGMLVDIKTTKSAAPWDFPRQAESLGYFRKLAFYRRGLRAIDWPFDMAAVLAIESAAPYDLVCYLLEDADLDSADAEVTKLLRTFQHCVDDDVWDGYAAEFQPLTRPAWAKEKEDITA